MIQTSSLNMYDIATHFSKATELYVDCEMHHGLDKNCVAGDTSCHFTSDFGTGLTTVEDVVKYIVQRTAIFFQAVKNNKTGSLNRKIFIECENKRKKCNGSNTDDDNNCTTTDQCQVITNNQ